MKEKKKIGITMLLSVFSIALSMGLNFTLTPYITNKVGAEAYGFVSLSKQFISYANIFMMALNSYAARYLTIAYAKEKRGIFRKYYSTVFIADVFFGGVLFVIGCLFVLNLNKLLNISQELVADVKLLFLLIFISFFLTSINTVFQATAYVQDHLDYANIIKVTAYLAEALVLIFCFFLYDTSVWYVGLASVLMAFLTLSASYIMTKKLIPESHVKCKDFSWQTLKKMLGNGLWNSVNSLGNGLNSGLDLLISNLMLNGMAMGQVSIAKNLSGILFQFYDAISQPFQPILIKKYAEGDKKGLLRYLKKSMSISGMFTNIIFAGFCTVGYDFLCLWIPTQDNVLIYKLIIIALLPAVSEGCLYPAYYIYTLTLKNKFPCIITIIGGILNVSGMYFLLKYSNMGIYSILITTAIIMNFINLVTNPLYMCRCLKIKIFQLYSTIIKSIFGCALSVFCMYFMARLFTIPVSWFNLLIKIPILTIVGIVVQLPLVLGKTGNNV